MSSDFGSDFSGTCRFPAAAVRECCACDTRDGELYCLDALRRGGAVCEAGSVTFGHVLLD